MRRIVVLLVISAVMVLASISVAGAYPGDPGSPGNPGSVQVAGISATRSASSGGLAFTGSNGTSTLLWVGGALVVLGAAVIVMTRRRHVSPGA